jgi:hypothetical protein
VHNVDQTSQDIQVQITSLQQFAMIVRDEVAPLFGEGDQATLAQMSETALTCVRELQSLSTALVASLRFSLRNVSTAARDAVMFHQQQVSMRVQHKFNIDPEQAEVVLGWLTGEFELPEGVSDTKAINALLWLINDTQEAFEGMVFEDDYALDDAS